MTMNPFWTLAIALLAALCFGCGDSDSSPTATPTATLPGDATSTQEGDDPTPNPTRIPPEATPTRSAEPPAVSLELVVEGLVRPTFATHAGDGSGRLFVTEKQGTIRTVAGGQIQTIPFIDISDRVDSSANERGLLGLAFHPEFEENGLFFAAYTADDGVFVLSAFETLGGGSLGDPSTEHRLLEIAHPRSNHNGGMLAFGADGFLYVSTGDGGGAGDPDRAGQDLSALAGKLLRLDVSEAENGKALPAADNPFRDDVSAAGEIWAYGLRNPWRFSFDRGTGDLWIADVGQGSVEEVNFQPAGSDGGENYGWSVMEGDRCFRPDSGCSQDGLQLPVHVYGHGSGCSITGGYVYRGSAIAQLRGFYLFTDYCNPTLIAVGAPSAGSSETFPIGQTPGTVSSFGEDEDGEVYVVSDGAGTLSRIVAAP